MQRTHQLLCKRFDVGSFFKALRHRNSYHNEPPVLYDFRECNSVLALIFGSDI